MVVRGIAAGTITALVFLSACGGGQPAGPTPTAAIPQNGVLVVKASEWRFEPSRILIHQGEQVRIEFQNAGQILHDLKIDTLKASGIESESNGPLSAGQGELFVGADTGKGGTLVFTAAEPGTFTYYCTIPRHRQLGMKGTLVVE